MLSVGEFPRDSADPSPAGPRRMCSTASTRPMPHIRARRPRPDAPDPHLPPGWSQEDLARAPAPPYPGGGRVR